MADNDLKVIEKSKQAQCSKEIRANGEIGCGWRAASRQI